MTFSSEKSSSMTFSPEKTFTAYSSADGAMYAKARPTYHANLYKRILDHHVSTGGHLQTLVDVGCGPGTVVRALAGQFETAIGLDPSEGMIATARQLGDGSTSGSGQAIRFEQSTAEQLGDVADGSVDLITAATAAHWFDMERFWRRAARALRPGGSVAIWIAKRAQVHQDVPNSEAIQACIETHMREELAPYREPGNWLVERLYVGLTLPWELTPVEHGFDRGSLVRKEWGTPGNADADAAGDEFFSSGRSANLDGFSATLATVSPVTRWRQAHPDKVGTDDDVVQAMRRDIARLLHEAGVPEGREELKGRVVGVLLMVKRT